MNIRQRLQLAVILLLVMLTCSVAGYRLLGGPSVSFLNALYMAVITLAGVGYGEIVETAHNPSLRVFNMLVVLFGVTIMVYVFSVVTAFLVEGELTHIFWRRKMEKRIRELKDHYIVCGLGDTGRYVIDELQKTASAYVVVDHSEEVLTRYREQAGNGRELLSVTGDATDDEVLAVGGVERAQGLIAALGADKDNLVITVMVRQKNSRIRIVARCTDLRFTDKLLRAGANSTVSPNRIGGLRLASEMLRPHVVSFLDLMLKEQTRTLRIEEIEVGPSSWAEKRVSDLDLKARFGLLLLAVKDAGGATYWANPPENLALRQGTVLIVMGDVAQIRKARVEAQHKSGRAMDHGTLTSGK
jgi:voltage-gated potassium channel